MARSALYVLSVFGCWVASIMRQPIGNVVIESCLPACLPATLSTEGCKRFLATRNKRRQAVSRITYSSCTSLSLLVWPQWLLPWVSRHISCISVTVRSDESCNDDSYCQWSGARPWNVRALPNRILNQDVLLCNVSQIWVWREGALWTQM